MTYQMKTRGFFLNTHIPEGNEKLILQLFLFKYGLTLNSSR